MSENKLIEFDAVIATAAAIIEQVATVEIVNSETAENSVGIAKELKLIESEAELIRKKLLNPLKTEVDRINNYAKQIIDPISRSKKILSDKVMTWQRSENERKEKIRKLEIERQEKIRLAEELRIKKLQEKEIEKFEKKAEKLIANEKPVPEFISAVPVSPPLFREIPEIEKTKLIKTMKISKWKIDNLNLIPREYFILDESRITREVKSSGMGTKITGITVYQEEVTSL